MTGSVKAKIFWGILIAVVVVWIAGALWLDSLIAASIRKVGSYLTGTPVNVTSVSLKVFQGKLKLNGFTVGNPDGYRSEQLLAVEDFAVELNVKSLFSDKIEISLVEIGGMHLDYEPSIAGKSNVTQLLDNLAAKTGGKNDGKNGGNAQSADAETQKKAQKQVVIRKLIVRDTALSVSSSVLRSTLKLSMPLIEMDNVGEGTKPGEGKNVAVVLHEFFTRLLLEITKVFDFNRFSGQLKQSGEQILQNIDKATDTVGGAVVSAGNSAGEAVNDVLNRSKDLVRGLPGLSK